MNYALRRVSSVLSLFLIMIISGCTFYGQHNAAELTRNQLSLLDQQIQDSYVRSHATFERLENATRQNAGMQKFADRYRHVLNLHGDLVNVVEQRRVDLGESTDYRKLSRLLRATTTGREQIDSGYQKIAHDLMEETGVFQRTNPYASDAVAALIPPFYRATQSLADQHTVVDGLRALNY